MIKKYFTYYKHNLMPHWVIFALDIAIVMCAYYVSYLIRFDLIPALHQLSIVMLSASLSFLIVGSYKSAVRYTGFSDLFNLCKSVLIMSVTFGFIILLNRSLSLIPEFEIPFSIVLIHSLLSIFLLSFSRLIFRNFHKYLKYNQLIPKRVLVYGMSDEDEVAYNILTNNGILDIVVVGFINYGQFANKKQINGIPIWSESKITQDFVETHDIEEILILSENIDIKSNLILDDLKIKITHVPSAKSWINGELTLKRKQVSAEEILGRPLIKINNTNVRKEFIGETLLVTGAAGCVGKQLVMQLIDFDVKKLILIDQSENDLYDLQQQLEQNGKHNFTAIVADISDPLKIDMLFQEYGPDVVFHTAEYRNEQLMEKYPYEAIKMNINGTKILADASSRFNVRKFIFASTYKAINPTSIIGITKRLAELYLTCLKKESKTKYIIVRCANIVDAKNSLKSNFERQIPNSTPIRISNENSTGFFTTISEVVELILEAGTMGKGGDIFNFDTGQPIKIFDIAKRMINLYGLNCLNDLNVKVTSINADENVTEELKSTIEKPVYTYHKKVMILNTLDFDYVKIRSEIEELCLNSRFQHTDIVLKMKDLIPDSKPDNSDYQHLYNRVQSYKKTLGMLPEETNQVKTN